MRYKKILFLTMAALMCFGLTACGRQADSERVQAIPTSISLTESWEFTSGFYTILSAANSSNYGATYWNRNFYNTLVCYDDAGEIKGELAEAYDISDDGLTYTFHLRKEVKFSDGTPLTADSVKKSISAAIINLGTYNGSYGKLTTLIANMETPDENTFVMTLSNPYYGALNDLTMCTPLAIVNPAAFKGGESNALENCRNVTMGTGPYMFTGDFDGTTYTFIRNPYYWGEAPELDRFQIKVIEDNEAKVLALRSGEIDAIFGSSRMNYNAFGELADDSSFGSSVNEKSNLTRYLGMNLSKPPFDDALVRQAVAYVIDQKELEDSVFGGIETAAETLFSSDKPFCNVKQTTYNTDVNKASSLMEQAGWIDSDGDGIREKGGRKLELELSYTQSLSSIDDATMAIASQLEKIGFKITTVGADMMSWYGDIIAGDYTLALWYTYGGAFDPTTVMTNMNPATSSDPIVVQFAAFLSDSAILEELNSASDLARVQEIYTHVLRTIADQNLMVPVTYTHEMGVWKNLAILDYDYYPEANYVNVSGIQLK